MDTTALPQEQEVVEIECGTQSEPGVFLSLRQLSVPVPPPPGAAPGQSASSARLLFLVQVTTGAAEGGAVVIAPSAAVHARLVDPARRRVWHSIGTVAQLRPFGVAATAGGAAPDDGNGGSDGGSGASSDGPLMELFQDTFCVVSSTRRRADVTFAVTSSGVCGEVLDRNDRVARIDTRVALKGGRVCLTIATFNLYLATASPLQPLAPRTLKADLLPKLGGSSAVSARQVEEAAPGAATGSPDDVDIPHASLSYEAFVDAAESGHEDSGPGGEGSKASRLRAVEAGIMFSHDRDICAVVSQLQARVAHYQSLRSLPTANAAVAAPAAACSSASSSHPVGSSAGRAEHSIAEEAVHQRLLAEARTLHACVAVINCKKAKIRELTETVHALRAQLSDMSSQVAKLRAQCGGSGVAQPNRTEARQTPSLPPCVKAESSSERDVHHPPFSPLASESDEASDGRGGGSSELSSDDDEQASKAFRAEDGATIKREESDARSFLLDGADEEFMLPTPTSGGARGYRGGKRKGGGGGGIVASLLRGVHRPADAASVGVGVGGESEGGADYDAMFGDSQRESGQLQKRPGATSTDELLQM